MQFEHFSSNLKQIAGLKCEKKQPSFSSAHKYIIYIIQCQEGTVITSDGNIKQWLISIISNLHENNGDDWPQKARRPPPAASWRRKIKDTDLSHRPPSLLPSHSHLFIHEDIDDWVDDRAGLGQDWGDDARLGRDQAPRPEGGQQGHDAVRQPAQQVADHHNHHHE